VVITGAIVVVGGGGDVGTGVGTAVGIGVGGGGMGEEHPANNTQLIIMVIANTVNSIFMEYYYAAALYENYDGKQIDWANATK